MQMNDVDQVCWLHGQQRRASVNGSSLTSLGCEEACNEQRATRIRSIRLSSAQRRVALWSVSWEMLSHWGGTISSKNEPSLCSSSLVNGQPSEPATSQLSMHAT